MKLLKAIYEANPAEAIISGIVVLFCSACMAMLVVGIAAAWMETGERFEE